ncbi:methyltransferase [Fundidesulfovibrio butyratiphilus]
MNSPEDARAFFPRGLVQPRTGYRFSLDPLLLAAFVKPGKRARLLDLGAGCGVAGLAALLLNPERDLIVLGVDIDPEQARASRQNARLLGFADACQTQELDLRRVREVLPPEGFDLVLANPPYRPLGTGHVCPNPGRAGSRDESTATLRDFLQAASFTLANRGRFATVFPAWRLVELLAGCQLARLTPKRLRLVHSRLEENARLVLLEAVKNAGEELTVEPPLVLYENTGKDTRLTDRALEFCPFLGAGREQSPPL